MNGAAIDATTLSEQLGAGVDTIRRTLDRYVGKDWIKLPNTKPVLYGPMSMARV